MPRLTTIQLSKGLVVLVVLASALGACTRSGDSDRLIVSAASSLAGAFGEMATAYEKEHPGVEIDLNIGGSQRLRQQIIEGAPVDVFASANMGAMDGVVRSGEAVGPPAVFALNSLVIGVPAGNPAGVFTLADFADASLLVGICAEQVPCGSYALESFALAGVVPSIDSLEPDVGALVLKLELGELDAGVVYRTDAQRSGARFDSVDIPDEHNVVAPYPIVGLTDGPSVEDFIDFVLSERGRAILEANGFDLP